MSARGFTAGAGSAEYQSTRRVPGHSGTHRDQLAQVQVLLVRPQHGAHKEGAGVDNLSGAVLLGSILEGRRGDGGLC